MNRSTTHRKELPAARGATPSEPAPADRRRPLRTIRLDDCSASIWTREHTGANGPRTFYSVTLERSYKDRDGAWKYSHSFDADSLGKVITLCQQASEAIADLQHAADDQHDGSAVGTE